MFGILSNFYAETHDNELGGVLGGFDTSFSGKPFEPAAWQDWIKAVQKITSSEQITEEEARQAMLVLMKDYDAHDGFDLKKVIQYFSQESKS